MLGLLVKPVVLKTLQLFRPSHWIKNIFIFLPLFFAQKIDDTSLLLDATTSFVLFCLCASGVYMLNDIRDVEDDRIHPLKRNRPIASGLVGIKSALPLSIVLIITSTGLAFITRPPVGTYFAAYVGLNMLYTLGLKHVLLIDINLIALGFVIRLFIGAESTGVELTPYIIILTFLLALTLGTGKRYNDITVTGRQNKDEYTPAFTRACLVLHSAAVVCTYLVFSLDEKTTTKFHSEHVYLTAVFVLLGILRYLQVTLRGATFSSPTEVVYKDHFIQVVLLAFLTSFVFILYL